MKKTTQNIKAPSSSTKSRTERSASSVTDILDLSSLPRETQLNLIELLGQYDKRLKYSKLEYLFPDKGPYSRDKYSRHVDFFKAGVNHRERAVCGANRVGKSYANYYEIALHVTKLYPDWWPGRRFYEGVRVVCAGKTHPSITEIGQYYLLGNAMEIGTGLIPKDYKDRPFIVDWKSKPNVANGISSVVIKDIYGELNYITFSSYEQGRQAFEGKTLEVVSFDEEPPSDVYEEGLTRTATTDGIVMLTFTPLDGFTTVVQSYLPGGMFPVDHIVPNNPSKWVTPIEWDDVPHLTEKTKREMWESYLPHMREARSKGIPAIGSGKIYPIPESNVVIDPFEIPSYWPRFYGMDVGFHCTAAVFFAVDPTSDTYYIYDEYYGNEVVPEVASTAILRKGGKWIHGVVDPSSMRGSTRDGAKLAHEYRDLGLQLRLANNSIELGIQQCYSRFSSGRMKIMRNCSNTIMEYRTYCYDDKGMPKKNQKDHAMDAMKYGVLSGAKVSMSLDDFEKSKYEHETAAKRSRWQDMGRSSITGY